MTPDQRKFCDRLGITEFELQMAVQTCGVPQLVHAKVEAFGSTNVYRSEGGKAVRYGDEAERLWATKKKRGEK